MKSEEKRNKELLINISVLGIIIVIFYIGLVIASVKVFEKGLILNLIISSLTILFIIICFILVKMETNIGYHECSNCHNKYIPTYSSALLAPHMFTTRYLKCPKCGKRSWSKKVMTK